MHSNPTAGFPNVNNARYMGHGFGEEELSNDPDDDKTIPSHSYYQPDDSNNTFAYTTSSADLERLVSSYDPGARLSYQNDSRIDTSKLTQIYKNVFNRHGSPGNANTSNEPEPTAAGPGAETFSSRFSAFIGFVSSAAKVVASKTGEFLSAAMGVAKSVFLYILGIAIGVFLTMFFFALFSHFVFNLSSRNAPKPDQKKPPNQQPPAQKPEAKRQEPPPRPEFNFEPVHFKDILGIDEAKEDVLEIVKFIKKPYLYKKVGAKIPKGILLVGAPGTGKTMLARAVATGTCQSRAETGIPFIYTSGPEFVEIYVGQGAQRIRALFQKARKIAPCIIFIDEIDAVGSKRASGSFSGQNREHDQTLNQLLVEMDGFNVSSGITILAATNRMNTLDQALLRPGRFDRVVHIPLPSIKGREEILRHYLQGVNYDHEAISVRDLAKITPGYSGADLKNLVNEAALITVKHSRPRPISDRTLVELHDLYEARDKIIMGNRRNLLMPELERRMTAYHEAGHALVAYHLYPNTDPIHKATIITRGTALGFVEQLPKDEYDKSSYKLIEMKSRLAVCMAGRLAEKLVFGFDNVTSGASSDILVATELAYKMITQYGMSRSLASLNFQNLNSMNNRLSSELNIKIENEIMKLIREAERLAESILRSHRKQLELLASELLKHETLTGEQIATLLRTNRALELPDGDELRRRKAGSTQNVIQPDLAPGGHADSNRNDDDEVEEGEGNEDGKDGGPDGPDAPLEDKTGPTEDPGNNKAEPDDADAETAGDRQDPGLDSDGGE